jgi:hypothetical protein
VEQRVVRRTEGPVAEALKQGTTAEAVHTSCGERFHGTQRPCKARKARQVSTFSKGLIVQVAVTWLGVTFSTGGRTPRTLRGRGRARPPR